MPVDILIVLIPVLLLAFGFGSLLTKKKSTRRKYLIIAVLLLVVFFAIYLLPGITLVFKAKAGDGEAQYWLSYWYLWRFGYNWPDEERSWHWLKKSADSKYLPAAIELAGRYHDRAVTRSLTSSRNAVPGTVDDRDRVIGDLKKSLTYYRVAATLGFDCAEKISDVEETIRQVEDESTSSPVSKTRPKGDS